MVSRRLCYELRSEAVACSIAQVGTPTLPDGTSCENE